MSDLFDDTDDEKIIIVDDEIEEAEEFVDDHRLRPVSSDARRRLEALMEERRLQNELDDYLDE